MTSIYHKSLPPKMFPAGIEPTITA